MSYLNESIKALPKGMQKSAESIVKVRKEMNKIAEDFASGNAINYFDEGELGFSEGDLLDFQETPLFTKLVNVYTKAYMDKKYNRLLERETRGLSLSEADGRLGTGTKKFFTQFIPEKVYSKMIETLYEARIGKDLLTTTLPVENSKGLTIPVQGDRMKAVVINELTPIPTQLPTFTKITVRPYTIGVGFNLSDDVVEEANVNLIRLLMEEVVWSLAEKQDNDIMAMLVARAGTKNTSKAFGAVQWTEDMQVLEDELYNVDLAVVGNTIATYFRRMPDFASSSVWQAAPEIVEELLRRGWVGNYFGIPLRRLHTSRFATASYMMLNNTNMKNPVSALVTYKGIRFNSERTEAYRAQATFAHMSYSPVVLNSAGILTTGCTS